MTFWTGRRVVVTGADGFIGSCLVEQLVAAGARVRALALYNSFDSFGWLDEIAGQEERLELVRGDVRDPHFVRQLLAEQEVVLHLAALISIPYSYVAGQSYVDTNVAGTLNILEAARHHRTPRVVTTSTSEVYGTALYEPIDEKHPLQGQSPYSASKIGADMMAEAYARSHGVPVVILRPFNTFGPRQSERAVIPTIIRQALDPRVPSIQLGDLTPRRDFTFVADTAAAFMAAAATDGLRYGEPYNAGNGRSITIGELVETVRRELGVSKPVTASLDRTRPSASEVRALIADSRKFTDASGWTPRTSLSDGLRITADWWRGRMARGLVRSANTFLA